jgi:hypothetical protein
MSARCLCGHQGIPEGHGCDGKFALLLYTTNTEVAASAANFTHVSNAALPTRVRTASDALCRNTRSRTCAADGTRDFSFPISRGIRSTSIALTCSAARTDPLRFGIAAVSTTRHEGRTDRRELRRTGSRYGRFGSYRASFDLNYVILKDEQAFRVDGLLDKKSISRTGLRQGQARLRLCPYEPKFPQRSRHPDDLLGQR